MPLESSGTTAPGAAAPGPVPASDSPDLRVLVAEDDPVMLAMYQEVLRDFGYLPICASDGGEAWRLFQSENPALVILDVLM
ncbi:MAG TPA: response regulator, partial [Gemmatimonadaceae bacterium]|nr:response regulator [Gemmatimonadaceae bacterium]